MKTKKYHCQISEMKCVVNAKGRHDAAKRIGFEPQGVFSVNAKESVYSVQFQGQPVVLTVSEMLENEETP